MNEELWLKVFIEGREVSYSSGWGAEAGWVFSERELEVDGLTFYAASYTTEARVVKDLFVYSESTEKRIHIGWLDEVN